MIALNNDSKPSIAVHPGFVLKEELESRHITQRKFAEVIGVPYTQLNEILNEKRPMSADFALAVEAALGIKAYIWVKLQADYNLQIASENRKTRQRLENIRKICASLL